MDSIFKYMQGIVKLRGGTDNTLIGNSGSSVNTNVTASSLPSGASTESTQISQSTLIGAVNETAPASDTASVGVNGRLQRIAQRVTSLITAIGSPFQAGASIGNTAFGATQSGSWTVIADHVDTSPATQNITTRDLATSNIAGANAQNFVIGNPTNGSHATFSIDGMESAKIIVTGTWTGTLAVEVSYDGGTIYTTNGVHQTGSAYTTNNFTSNFVGGLNIAAATNLRVRATAAWTGTATIRIIESLNPQSVYIANGLNIQDSVIQSNKMTIKSASTAAVATDTSAVVSINPNTPLPAGTNGLGKLTANAGVTIGAVEIAAAQTLATVTTVGAVTAITNALPAGTNAIGKLAPNSGVDIGDVDVTSVPADPFGVNADAASATGSISAKLKAIATALGVTAFDLGSGTSGSRTLRTFQDTAQFVGGAGPTTSAAQRMVLAAPNTMYTYNIPSQGHVAVANTVHWDFFNADAAVAIRVLSIRQIPNITTAVTGIVFDWLLERTTAVGTGGSAQTAWLSDLNGTALDADVTCRSKPTGGATQSTDLFNFSISSEETNAATIQLATMGGLELIPPPLVPLHEGRGIVLRQNQGLRLVQVTNSNAGNTAWLITFTQE